MEFFSSYIKSILSVALCSFICNNLCESFSSSKTLEKAIAITTSLCMFIIVIMPLCSAMSNIRISIDGKNEADTAESTAFFKESIEKETESRLSQLIVEETGIIPCDTTVYLTENDNTYSIKKISISLPQENISDKTAVFDFLDSITDKKTVIEITENIK